MIIASGAVVNLTLQGSSIELTSGSGQAAVYVPSGATLNISGEGGLQATVSGGNAAAIGGQGISGSAGLIQINSGTIIAQGAGAGAGIGGVRNNAAQSIIINGGKVTATGGTVAGGTSAPGIGCTGNYGSIAINGGDITATGGSGQTSGIKGNVITSTGSPLVTANGGISGNTSGFHGVLQTETSPNKVYIVYGNAILPETFPSLDKGDSMTIPGGASLTIPENNPFWTVSGSLYGEGRIVNAYKIIDDTEFLSEDLDLMVVLKEDDILTYAEINGQDLVYNGTDQKSIALVISKEREEGDRTYAVDTSGWVSSTSPVITVDRNGTGSWEETPRTRGQGR